MDKKAEAKRLRASGMSYRAIAAELGVTHTTAYRWVNDIKSKPPEKKGLRQEVVALRARVAELEDMLRWGVDLEPIERRLACLEDLTNGRCG